MSSADYLAGLRAGLGIVQRQRARHEPEAKRLAAMGLHPGPKAHYVDVLAVVESDIARELAAAGLPMGEPS